MRRSCGPGPSAFICWWAAPPCAAFGGWGSQRESRRARDWGARTRAQRHRECPGLDACEMSVTDSSLGFRLELFKRIQQSCILQDRQAQQIMRTRTVSSKTCKFGEWPPLLRAPRRAARLMRACFHRRAIGRAPKARSRVRSRVAARS